MQFVGPRSVSAYHPEGSISTFVMDSREIGHGGVQCYGMLNNDRNSHHVQQAWLWQCQRRPVCKNAFIVVLLTIAETSKFLYGHAST